MSKLFENRSRSVAGVVFNLVLKFDFGTDLALTVTQISEEFW
jgi:hypothetical protein